MPKGTPKYASDRSPRDNGAPKAIPDDTQIGAAQPRGSTKWHPVVKAWWKALGMSDTARVFQQFDWTNAWVAADILDNMYNLGFTPGLIKEWHTIVSELHQPRLDLLYEQPEEAPEVDEDDEAAAAEISDIKSRMTA